MAILAGTRWLSFFCTLEFLVLTAPIVPPSHTAPPQAFQSSKQFYFAEDGAMGFTSSSSIGKYSYVTRSYHTCPSFAQFYLLTHQLVLVLGLPLTLYHVNDNTVILNNMGSDSKHFTGYNDTQNVEGIHCTTVTSNGPHLIIKYHQSTNNNAMSPKL